MIIKGEGTSRIVAGRLIRDAEFSTFGNAQHHKVRLAVSCGNGKGESEIMNVDTLFDLADTCRGLKKNDKVIVAGTIESYKTNNGDKRWYLSAEAVSTPSNMNVYAENKQQTQQSFSDGFAEVSADEEFPF